MHGNYEQPRVCIRNFDSDDETKILNENFLKVSLICATRFSRWLRHDSMHGSCEHARVCTSIFDSHDSPSNDPSPSFSNLSVKTILDSEEGSMLDYDTL